MNFQDVNIKTKKMNILQKIEKAFNKHQVQEVENVYIPKIQKSVIPNASTFNEIAENIREQLKPIQL
tara:strand:+ start:2192 stop:2392 length:201 start_codon:yes stop_codon:yes gene_type:complete